ncbi:MAG TPA: hypothetical protein VFO60_03035 [Candidatus Dormibacteraeota bacterium]|nr:hypothetical protein [Candidatus Dormibacteraeota bacterium]
MRIVLPAAAAVLAAACGAASVPPPCTPDPAVVESPPGATAGPLTIAADRGTVPRGGTVRVTVTLTGPADVTVSCDGPVSLAVTDASDIHVFAAATPAEPGEPCGEVTLAAAQTAVYEARWDVDPTTPSGLYEVSASVGDLPASTVAVRVSGALPGAPAC